MALSPLVGMWFQVHYPPLVGVLLIFRSRYCFAIGRQGVLSLAGWAPRIQTNFHVFGPTQVPDGRIRLSPTGLSPSLVDDSTSFGWASSPSCPVLQPHPESPGGLGWSAFARRYLRSRGFFLLLQVLRCFSSLGSPL